MDTQQQSILTLLRLIRENTVRAWEPTLEECKDAVILEDFNNKDDEGAGEIIVYNGWFEKLQDLIYQTLLLTKSAPELEQIRLAVALTDLWFKTCSESDGDSTAIDELVGKYGLRATEEYKDDNIALGSEEFYAGISMEQLKLYCTDLQNLIFAEAEKFTGSKS